MEKRILKHILALGLLAGLLFTVVVEAQSAFNIRWGDQSTYSNTPANTLKQWAEGMEGRIGTAGKPPLLGTGNIYYVDSNVNSEGSATTWASAKDTIEEAYDLCTVNNGDIVYVAQGHKETLGTLVLDTEGVSIVGIGEGEDRPEITWDTTSDVITISAASNIINNLSFRAGIDVIEIALNITADGDYTTIWGCDFPEPTSGAFDFKTAIQLTTAADYVTVVYCTYKHADAVGPVEFIDGGAGAVQGLTVVGNYLYSEFSAAAIFSDQTDLEVMIAYNTITNMTNNLYAIQMGGSATGWLIGNKVATDTYATAIEAGGLAVDESTTWCDYGQTDVVAVPYFANVTGVARMSATEKAEVQTEVTSAIEADLLEKLLSTATADTTDPVDIVVTEVADDSVMAHLMTQDGDASGFERVTDSQEGLAETLETILAAGGDVYYVDSALGTDNTVANGYGKGWGALAFDSIDYASSQCTANNGDVILVAPGHAITLGATQISLAEAGVTIIGMGEGNDRPLITFNDAASSVDVTAADIKIKNIRFYSTTINTTVGITISATGDGCILEDCEFTDTGGFEFDDTVVLANLADRVTIRRCNFFTGVLGSAAIKAAAGPVDRLVIEDCRIWGGWNSAAVYSNQICTNVLIKNCEITNNISGVHAIEIPGVAATGDIINCNLVGDTYGAILDPGSMRVFNCKQSLGIDRAAIDVPLVSGKTYAMSASVDEVTATTLFDVQNGEIMIHSFYGQVDVLIGATVATIQIICDADDGAAWDVEFSTAVNFETDVAGTKYSFSAANPAVMAPLLKGGTEGSGDTMHDWFCPEGLIIQTVSADPTGAAGDHLTWYMMFTPLSDGVMVVPGT